MTVDGEGKWVRSFTLRKARSKNKYRGCEKNRPKGVITPHSISNDGSAVFWNEDLGNGARQCCKSRHLFG